MRMNLVQGLPVQLQPMRVFILKPHVFLKVLGPDLTCQKIVFTLVVLENPSCTGGFERVT